MRKVLEISLFLFFLLIICKSAISSGNDELFNKGNEAFRNNNYQKAIENYEKIIKSGSSSSGLYYNLGTSYHKLRNVPNSILNLERAKRLAPDDPDIDFNLKIANLRVIDKFDELPRLFLTDWYENVLNSFSSSKWAVISVIFSWITFACLAGFLFVWSIRFKKVLFALSIIAFCLTITFTFFTFNRESLENRKDEGIIFSTSVYVKNSPDDKSTDLFILHEGTKVNLTEIFGSWVKIRLSNGNIGWVPKESIQII